MLLSQFRFRYIFTALIFSFKNMHRKYLLLLLSLMFSLFLMAEPDDVSRVKPYTVKGSVKNHKGEAVPYASVRVLGTNIGISADARGEFSLKMKGGRYKFRFSCTGYENLVLEVDASEEPVLNVVLKEAVGNLDEVVVTGMRSEKMLKEAPIVTRIITSEDIKRIDPQDIISLLEYELPGLQFARNNHGLRLPSLTFYGMSGKYLLFLIDGERFGGETSDDNIDFNRLGIDNIERIEIVKGAVSTLYGSSALSGVINIITKKATRPFIGNLSSRIGSYGSQKYSLSLGTRQNRFSALTSVIYNRRKPYCLKDREGIETIWENPEGKDSVSFGKEGEFHVRGYENLTLSQKLGYDFTEHFGISLKGGYYNNKISVSEPDEIKALENMGNKFYNANFSGAMHYIPDENSRIDFSYGYDNYKQNRIKDGEKDCKYKNILKNARLTYTALIADRHDLVIGLETRSEELKHNWIKDTKNEKNHMAYLQDNYKVTDKLRIEGGIRADYHSEYKFHMNPQLSLMMKENNLILRVGYAGGFRLPAIKERFADYSESGFFIVEVNPDLKPETSRHFFLSGEYTEGIFNASITGYYNKYKDRIFSKSWRENKKWHWTYVNVGRSKTFGIDVNTQLRFPFALTLKGAYSYVDDMVEIDGKNNSYVRPHTAVMGADYNRKIGRCRTSFGISGRWMGALEYWRKQANHMKKQVYTKKVFDARTIWKLNATCTFPRGIALTMGVDNLFNHKDKNVSSDSYASFFRGREFSVNLSFNLAELGRK